jgi:hypothetical protein
MDISLHIVLQKPPTGVDFGLQKGSGSKYETVQIQRSVGEDLHFYFTIGIKGERIKDIQPKFRSPFVQGSPPDNFIYIDIGTYAGQVSLWGRRLKIPLSGITWEVIDKIQLEPQLILETHVPGTAKDGSPSCATVKPFDGWKTVVSEI